MALLSPFVGRGIVWQGLLPITLLMALCFVGLPCIILKIVAGGIAVFLYMGLLGTYFGGSVRNGLDGRSVAAELPGLSNIDREMLYRGAALTGLSVLLFLIPGYLGWVAIADEAPQGEERPWDPGEKFTGTQNEPLVIGVGGQPVEARDAEGRRVVVDPHKGVVRTIPEGGDSNQGQGRAFWHILFLLSLLVPLFYWPMALTVVALTGSVLNLFNPVFVLKGIRSGGVKYATVAGVGAVLFVLSSVLVTVLSTTEDSGAAVVICALVLPLWINAYVSGVQAQLIGRMLHDQPEEFVEIVR